MGETELILKKLNKLWDETFEEYTKIRDKNLPKYHMDYESWNMQREFYNGMVAGIGSAIKKIEGDCKGGE